MFPKVDQHKGKTLKETNENMINQLLVAARACQFLSTDVRRSVLALYLWAPLILWITT